MSDECQDHVSLQLMFHTMSYIEASNDYVTFV